MAASGGTTLSKATEAGALALDAAIKGLHEAYDKYGDGLITIEDFRRIEHNLTTQGSLRLDSYYGLPS